MGSLSPEQSASVLPMSSTTARRYTLLRRLAVGGMGELLLAHASSGRGVQKLVAIKRVRPEYASDPAFVSMFLNEARLAATLDHPNVVRTYDLVEDANGCFMVMEYLHGESLGRVQNEIAAAGLRVPLEHVVTIVLGVAAGLHCAHERRGVDGRPLDIVHRDLSPGNVFVTYEGGVKLLDFGIAKATSRTSITVGPARKGKVSYMSPEQCVGADVDRRSDIFALGVVAWELCTGRRLFVGDNEFAIMNCVTTLDAAPPSKHVPELPTQLVEIVGKALRRDPAERFQTAMELHEAVEGFALAHGLMPSSTALGRWLTEVCGRREYPSVEPSAEFLAPEVATLVVPGTLPSPPRSRRASLLLAIAGGALLGAGGVAAASRGASEPPIADPPPNATATTIVEPVPLPLAPTSTPAPTHDEAVVVVDATDPPAAADTAPSSPSPLRSPAPQRAAKRRRSAPREPVSRPEPASPASDKPVRGIDGLLPRG